MISKSWNNERIHAGDISFFAPGFIHHEVTLKASRLIITPRRRVFPSGHTSSHDDEVGKSGTYGCINCYLSQDQSEQLCNSFHLIDYLGCVVTRFNFASVNADGKTTPPDRPSGSSLHQLGYTTCTSLHLEIRS